MHDNRESWRKRKVRESIQQHQRGREITKGGTQVPGKEDVHVARKERKSDINVHRDGEKGRKEGTI